MNILARFNQLKITLPSVYNEIDQKWLIETLGKLKFQERNKAIVKYAEVYSAAYEAEKISYKKENAAGRSANIRLRKYVERCNAKRNETVNEPPSLSM